MPAGFIAFWGKEADAHVVQIHIRLTGQGMSTSNAINLKRALWGFRGGASLGFGVALGATTSLPPAGVACSATDYVAMASKCAV